MGLLAGALMLACVGESKTPEVPVQISNKDLLTKKPSDRVPGEYIVTLRIDDSKGIVRELYVAYGVLKVTDIGRGRYLLKIQNDPGFAVMKTIVKNSPAIISIQPNFVYRGAPQGNLDNSPGLTP